MQYYPLVRIPWVRDAILHRGETLIREADMALDTDSGIASYDAPEKDLYEMGEMPPLGYVPKKMYAWAIRQERHGEPDTAMVQEVVDVPELDSNECWSW